MDNWPINPFDTVVFVTLLASGALAFLRGFTREVLSLVAWAGAAVLAYLFFPSVQPLSHGFIATGWLADAAAAMGVFIPALIVLWLLSHAISQRVKTSAIGALDRTLGFIFGLGRGAVIVVILFLGLGWLIPMTPEAPDWISKARTLPLVQAAADRLTGLGNDDRKIEKPLSGIYTMPAANDPDRGHETGYKPAERQDLEKLIDDGNASR